MNLLRQTTYPPYNKSSPNNNKLSHNLFDTKLKIVVISNISIKLIFHWPNKANTLFIHDFHKKITVQVISFYEKSTRFGEEFSERCR